MNIEQLLAQILNPNPGGMPVNQLTGPTSLQGPEQMAQTGLGPEQLARYHQMSGMGGGMPQAAPPAPAMQSAAPMAPQQAQAAPAPSGGGIGGLLGNLFGGAKAGENQTIQWLTGQGIDPGTATMMAKHKPALQAYLLQRSQGQKPIEVNGRLVDPNTFEVIADFSDKGDQGFSLSPGEQRYGSDGKLIASGAPPAKTLPAGVQEYEYAKSQGFPGTFADWEASKKGGMSLQVDPETGAVTFQQGSNIKPLTEGQSKDTVYATRAAGALPLIDQYGPALTSLGESVAGQVPGVGNYMKSKEFQQAEQAGKEFLQAILRKDTGAAIHEHEMESYGSVYLPRPGDGPEVLAQKKASRARALDAIKAGMPAQAILAQEKALAAGGDNAAPQTFNDQRGVIQAIQDGKLKIGDEVIVNGERFRIDP